MSTYRNNNDQIEFSLPKQGYAAFDASSLKGLIIDRLNSNETFTDQNYEGSNINAFIDVISYAYHVLLFYLNETSNETLFSESQIYENINRIVKSLDYKPVGIQTPSLSISAVGTSNLIPGTYTIPRYSYIDISGFRYSFNNDVTFVKSIDDEENLPQITGKVLLYQGTYKEYPEYTATGEPNEILTLVPGEGANIDHFNIDVYVKEGGAAGTFYKYNTTTSLFFEKPTNRAVEIRLNENKRYEIRFGNNVNGRQLSPGDLVYIYYIVSDASAGEIDAGDATRKAVTQMSSTQLESLKQSTNIRGDGVEYMSQTGLDNVLITNNEPSTKYYTGESVENIRENAPNTFNSQYRLVSIADYENYIVKNFSNFIANVKAIDNDTYLNSHIKYYYDLGLKNPSLESRVLYNQVQFSTSCNFNNLYIYCVPRLEKTTSITQRNNYLLTSQKELIVNSMSSTKTVTCDPIIMDPVYVAVNVGLKKPGMTATVDDMLESNIMIVQDDNSRSNSNDIIQKVVNIFTNYFNPLNASIGMNINLTNISNDILSIQGVNTIYTYLPGSTGVYVEGISLSIWNPVYIQDLIQTTQNYKLPVFKFPYFYNIDQLSSRIRVVRSSDSLSVLNTGTDRADTVSSSNIYTPNTSTNSSAGGNSTNSSTGGNSTSSGSGGY